MQPIESGNVDAFIMDKKSSWGAYTVLTLLQDRLFTPKPTTRVQSGPCTTLQCTHTQKCVHFYLIYCLD